MDGDVSERFLLWTDESIWTVIGRVEQWFDKGLSKEDGHLKSMINVDGHWSIWAIIRHKSVEKKMVNFCRFESSCFGFRAVYFPEFWMKKSMNLKQFLLRQK